MTSVPKPLKFMRAHYADLKVYYEGMPVNENKVLLFVALLSSRRCESMCVLATACGHHVDSRNDDGIRWHEGFSQVQVGWAD